jgi:DUF1009 family protein
MLSKLRSFNDDSILRGIIAEIESSGMEVIAASMLLDKSVPKPGAITQRHLSRSEREDTRIGWEAARAIGNLDIGQSVIVRNKTVIAASFATHLPFARYTSPATPNLSAFARVLRSSEGK